MKREVDSVETSSRIQLVKMLRATASHSSSAGNARRRADYVDLAPVWSNPAPLQQVANELAGMVKGTDKLACVGLGALPFVTVVAIRLNLPFFVLESIDNPQLTEESSLGDVTTGERVTIIHDVVNTGDTVARFVKFLRELGGKVDSVVTVVDLEAGAHLRLSGLSVSLKALVTLRELSRNDH